MRKGGEKGGGRQSVDVRSRVREKSKPKPPPPPQPLCYFPLSSLHCCRNAYVGHVMDIVAGRKKMDGGCTDAAGGHARKDDGFVDTHAEHNIAGA